MRSLARSESIFALICLAAIAPAATAQTTGIFGKCDPVIHDKLVGAEWRSPSDCEVQFDAFVRPALAAALQPAIDSLTAHGWGVTRQVELQTLTSIPRHTEAKPFQLTEQQLHQGGAFYVSLGLDKSTPVFAQWDTPVQAAMQKFGAALKSMNAGDGETAQKGLTEATKAEVEHTTIQISVLINNPGVGISSFKGGHTVTTLPKGGFAVSAPYVQAPTGGDVSAAQRVTYVFLGPFTAPAAAGPATGGEDVRVKGTLSLVPAKLLRVQNICIRIQTGSELAQQVINQIDWSALKQLMTEP
jgi:hypothetical protein